MMKCRLDHNHNNGLKTEVVSSTFLHHVPISRSPKNVVFQPMLHPMMATSSKCEMNHINVQLSMMIQCQPTVVCWNKARSTTYPAGKSSENVQTIPEKEIPRSSSTAIRVYSLFTAHGIYQASTTLFGVNLQLTRSKALKCPPRFVITRQSPTLH